MDIPGFPVKQFVPVDLSYGCLYQSWTYVALLAYQVNVSFIMRPYIKDWGTLNLYESTYIFVPPPCKWIQAYNLVNAKYISKHTMNFISILKIPKLFNFQPFTSNEKFVSSKESQTYDEVKCKNSIPLCVQFSLMLGTVYQPNITTELFTL